MSRVRNILGTSALALALATGAAHAQSASSATGDTITTASGLRYVITHRGEGDRAKVGTTAIVHYTGRLTDGKIFDSSREREEPFAFKLGAGQVIKGWDEGIAQLHIGDRAVLIIPAELGYGEKGAGEVIPPNSTLVFDVELLDIKEKTLGGMLAEVLDAKGAAAAKREYLRWKKGPANAYYVSEGELNALGYQCLKEGRTEDAMMVFEINTDLFPESANVYDSLGEACMEAGHKKQAIANYKRSLKLDPNNTNAVEMLKKLGAKK